MHIVCMHVYACVCIELYSFPIPLQCHRTPNVLCVDGTPLIAVVNVADMIQPFRAVLFITSVSYV